ncbi:MAG: asparagine synthase (glutamine-hydrolyzing) [Deltaproteobacteria bacterium]|nr:asparagine synthase (glutamine-hydrolyzing) [Deltaproteobacteria bacterium]MBM4321960.1 asparagine synthase (glutamine-hydrolyzing) [Deltaproteobacteria bacterium]
MCGICGKLNFDRQQPVDRTFLRRMMELIRHRGPDGGGEYYSGHIGLGHRRLSIIDLKTGDQPISNEDETVWVVFNGEVYNFQELRVDLESRGHKFKSSTDTEVIVHLYEEAGVECVPRLRGMFAFALWDRQNQLLLLARDRVGIKPLYYTITPNGFIFASEIKAILADPSVERRINPHAIDRFLTYGYLPGNETLLEGIYKLEPGHYMTVSDGKTSKRQYWDLHFETSPQWKNFGDAVEELRVLLRQTVKDHMISDVPVGVLLSGGVDSTGVLRYAVEQTNKPIHTFTIGFNSERFADERTYARLAAQRYATVHQDITMTAKDFCDFLPEYVWHMEEPVFEPPAIALYYVSKLARESGIKVLLSGEGGDEAFGGYQNYRNLLLLEDLKSFFGPAKGLLRFGFRSLGLAGWSRIGRYSSFVNLPLSEYYLSRTATPDSDLNRLKHFLYTKEFTETLRVHDSHAPTRNLFAMIDGQMSLNRMLYVDTKTWLPDDLLIKADKMTMATSVELRVPLLDFQVLEFAASLPTSFKVRRWTTKRVLKAALQDSVPREILKRKKTGFPVPYDKWLYNGMHDFVSDSILVQNSALGSYFDRGKVRHLLHTHRQNGNLSKEVFCLLMIELWYRAFMLKR